MNAQDKIFEVDITALVFGGDAMGRLPDGRAVFVPFALPGERVRLRLVEEKTRHTRAELLEVLKPSPQRIAPRCKHFAACGGCHYQHLPYEQQLIAKTNILREQFVRLGQIANPPVEDIIPSPAPWNYRNAVQFHLAPDGHPGYLAPGSHQVVPVSECHLPEPALNEIWPLLELEPGLEVERVELRLGVDEDVLLTLESQSLSAPEFSVDMPISAVHLGPGGPIVLAGDDHVICEVHGRLFRVSAGSFFQVNTRQAEAMLRHMMDILPLKATDTLLDLYCGVGLFSAFLADKVKRCIGVELSTSACTDFAANLDEFDNVELYEGAAEDVLPSLKVSPDVVIVDPPRSGLAQPVLDTLVKMQPQYLAYVSCDPATLARDVRRFVNAGYRLERVTPFDLFPQTYHIESISLLSMM